MSPYRVWHIAFFELTRHFLTRKALIALLAFALVWLMIFRYPIYEAVELLANPQAKEFASRAFDSFGITPLLQWQEAELSVYWLISLYCFPAFAVYLAADQFVSDRQRGTLRFIALRATRLEILLGRFSGQVITLSVLIALTLAGSVIMLSLRDPSLAFTGLLRAMQIEGCLMFTLLPFIALMSLFNVVAKSSRMALIYAILLFTLGQLILSWLQTKLPALHWLDYFLPQTQVTLLIEHSFFALALPVVQTAVLLFATYQLSKRSAL